MNERISNEEATYWASGNLDSLHLPTAANAAGLLAADLLDARCELAACQHGNGDLADALHSMVADRDDWRTRALRAEPLAEVARDIVRLSKNTGAPGEADAYLDACRRLPLLVQVERDAEGSKT